MYFSVHFAIKYYMFTKKRIALLIVIALLIIVVPIMATIINARAEKPSQEMQVLTLWQIDGFEGGKGSRAQYLKDKSVKLFKDCNVYLNVIPLSATAAQENLNAGEMPDMISCSPTFNAHLQYINSADFAYKTWCYGSYCLLALGENGQFDDVSAQNTVVNAGKDNLAQVAAAACGVGGAQLQEPTNAYLQLLNGKFKYLLGTQRDIYRLKTRGEIFSVKQITQFNDLYQNISILAKDGKRYATCKQFVEYIIKNNSDIDKLGLFSENAQKYSDELGILQESTFECALKSPCGNDYLSAIKDAAASNDAIKIKNLLK